MSLPAVEQLLECFGSWVGGESAWKRKYIYSFATALQAQLRVIEQLVGDWMSESVGEWLNERVNEGVGVRVNGVGEWVSEWVGG